MYKKWAEIDANLETNSEVVIFLPPHLPDGRNSILV